MRAKGLAMTLGLGACAGAVGILMLSRTNPARRLAVKAADKVEDVAWDISEKLTEKFDL